MPKAIAYVPYTGPIVKRLDARAAGLTHYFTGLPCGKGHLAQRFVSTFTCLVCWREHDRRFRALNRPRIRGYENAWKAANPEKNKQKKQRNYQRNRDAKIARHRAWRAANHDAAKASSKAWKQLHPAEHNVHKRNYRARRRGNGGAHTVDQILDLLEKQRNRCAACRKNIKSSYHADHIVPLARGGSNDIGNIQLLCVACNLSKGHSDPIEWAQKKGRLL